MLNTAGVQSLGALVDSISEDDNLVDLASDDEEENRSDQEFDQEFESGDEADVEMGDNESMDEMSEMNEEAPAQPMLAQQKKSYGKKFDGHLHETDMRVDPPLLDDGKKSIAHAEKTLEEQKEDYDKKKKFTEEKELAFHAAARVSKAARENRAKAEDRYYLASKEARKAMRYAENMEREAKMAAARQAAADKYNEVIASANKAATAKENVKPAKAQVPVKVMQISSNSTANSTSNATSFSQANATKPTLARK
jgi:hypothetical protein